jgi:hydroxymethylbilane synthase
MAQAHIVARALSAYGVDHELVVIHTDGDRRAPDTAWGEGAFVAAIEQALLDGSIDVAVHSAKDVPTEEHPRLEIAAFMQREDARDALVVAAGAAARTLDTLPAGTIIGTDSPRRTGFMRSRRPDIHVRPLHGNVDTRLRRLDAGEVDGLLLAVAGLVRLGRADRIAERVPVETLPPAPGQGALAVQVRADDTQSLELCARIDHRPTRLAVEAERTFLHAAGGGCRAPIGAFAETDAARLRLLGGFASVDGQWAIVDRTEGAALDGEAVAVELAARLGSRRLVPSGAARVLVTRPAGQSEALVFGLAQHGIEAVVVPTIAVELSAAGGPLDRALDKLDRYDWAVVTSVNGARAVTAATERLTCDPEIVRWAAVGEATARKLRAAGVADCWQPTTATGKALAHELPLSDGPRVLLVRGSLADDALPTMLVRRGAVVDEVTAYTTVEAPASSHALLEGAFTAGPLDGVVLASPSAVRGLLTLAGPERRTEVLALPAVAIGPTTAAAARDAGFRQLAEASTRDVSALAELMAELLASRVSGGPA